MGYQKDAFKGISWITVLRASTRGITFVRLAVLARILTPSQFGIFGIATLVLAFLEVITETGINVFLIQRKEGTGEYISPAWIVSIIRGCLIALILILSAPFIVKFFNSPQSYQVIILIALAPFIRGFINPSIVNIQKEIQFQKEFYLRLILFSVDAIVVIVSALVTRSVESFAYGLIVSAVLEVAFSFIFFRPYPKLEFEIDKIKHIINKGWWVTLTGIFSYFADNGDNILVGRIMGTASLGIYQAAYKISTLPISEITETVSKVVFPVYSKFSEDKERLLRAFSKVIAASSVVAFMLGFLIFIFAEQLILLILGDGWMEAVPVVKVLAFYGVLRTVSGSFTPMFLSLGKQNYVAFMTFVRVTALLILIVPLINMFGLMGAAYAAIVSIFVEIPVVLVLFYKIYGSRK